MDYKTVVIRENTAHYIVLDDLWDIIESVQDGTGMKDLEFSARVPGLTDRFEMSVFVRLKVEAGIKRFELCRDYRETIKHVFEPMTFDNQKVVEK